MQPIYFDLSFGDRFTPGAWEFAQERAYEAFRLACQGGGTPPGWTLCGCNPSDWVAPKDAAGGLVLIDSAGGARVEPTSDKLPLALLACGASADRAGIPIDQIRAYYRSCMGQCVWLLHRDGTYWTVAIARECQGPRIGARGEAILRHDPLAVVRFGAAEIRFDDRQRPVEIRATLPTGGERLEYGTPERAAQYESERDTACEELQLAFDLSIRAARVDDHKREGEGSRVLVDSYSYAD